METVRGRAYTMFYDTHCTVTILTNNSRYLWLNYTRPTDGRAPNTLTHPPLPNNTVCYSSCA